MPGRFPPWKLTGPLPGVEPSCQDPSVAHGSVAVDASSGVEVSQVNRPIVFPGHLDPILNDPVLEPMLDQATEGWDVNSSACCSWAGEQRVAGSGVCSGWSFALVLSPSSVDDFGVWAGLAWEEFGALPEGFDADGLDVFVGVDDGSVGGVAPDPTGEGSAFVRVVLAAGVDDDGFGVFDLGSHADGGEVSHADDWHLVAPVGCWIVALSSCTV